LLAGLEGASVAGRYRALRAQSVPALLQAHKALLAGQAFSCQELGELRPSLVRERGFEHSVAPDVASRDDVCGVAF
jgi:hypothetical protein